MPRKQNQPLRPFTATETAQLQAHLVQHSDRYDRMCRARALMAVSTGQSFAAAARAAPFASATTVRMLVRRFNRNGLAALDIADGRGRKPTYTTAQRTHIIQTVREAPDRLRDGTATWSLTTLRRHLQSTGLPLVSATTIRRVLHTAHFRYTRTRTWCYTGTVLRVRKTGVVSVTDPQTEEKRACIDLAYRYAEACGVALWCQDEAGPYRTMPQPGQTWAPAGQPARQPHEYIRNGTAKLLTLFHPTTGSVRVRGVSTAPNTVLHGWLKEELLAILTALPAGKTPEDPRIAPLVAHWARWWAWRSDPPPLRMILVWDNLAGHHTYAFLLWLVDHGILPLFTPLGGSWLNMAESIQRILVRRALAGQNPQESADIIQWLEDTARGWNAHPTPFVWAGKRAARRHRARLRYLGGSDAAIHDPHIFAA